MVQVPKVQGSSTGMGRVLYIGASVVILPFLYCTLHVALTVADGSHDYEDALSKSILFFEGQRSGKLPADQRMRWRGDSALSDGSSQRVDLMGGYYDAGDNVKFGLPMAFTTTMLAWSVLEFGGQMAGDDLKNARTAIRWATDYLLKATSASPDTLYVQVGNPNSDHKCWERAEDMDTPRTVYKINSSSPGSDIAAETAAALAAASIIFRKADRPYSKLLLNAAVKVFDFADRHRGSYSDVLRSDVCPFYCSYSGYQDELLWGAAWLQKATFNYSYIKYIQANGPNFRAYDNVNVFSWDNKHAGVQVLLAKEFLIKNVEALRAFKGLADNFICSVLPGTAFSQIQYTPGGLLYKMSDNNMQYVTAITFLIFTYAKYLEVSNQVVKCGNSNIAFGPGKLRTIAKRQVDYILGENPEKISYMVGYGPKFPLHVHHRGSSLPSIFQHPQFISCNDGFHALHSKDPNPNILVGAVVGGPDSNDQYADDRTNYGQSESPTYINAPLVGSLASLVRRTKP